MKKMTLRGVAAMLCAVPLLFASCSESGTDEVGGVIKITPSDDIEFKASGNEDVVLTVSAGNLEWDVFAPEWVTLDVVGDQISVNARDNATDATRIGRLQFVAGSATTYVGVVQYSANEAADKVTAAIENSTTVTRQVSDTDTAVEGKLTITLNQPATTDVELKVVVDEAYLSEYNYNNKATCTLFPTESLVLGDDGQVTIPAGKTSAEVSYTFTVSGLKFNTSYLVPLSAEAVSSNVTVTYSRSRMNWVITKHKSKEVQNMVFLEVNQTNPLNVLEYKLADGQYFFDAVVIFAANINYNGEEDRVYLNNNPNVQALLDESDVYLQPLREQGIKVYLGLLGNHDAAGLCGLTDWGAQEYAKEVAEACRTYKLDGVNMDEEYSSYQGYPTRWFIGGSSAQAGSRLAYELKKAMNEACDWPCEVSYFQYSTLYNAYAVDGHQPGEFIDINVPNYGSRSSAFAGQTNKNCAYASFECNLGSNMYNATASTASTAKNNGYGWLMWFAWDPSPLSPIYHNRDSYIKDVAKGLYDVELVTPTHYYRKIGEGVFDPKRYAR